MKKISALLLTTLLYTFGSAQAFADNINPCPDSTNNPQFANLCSINANPNHIVQVVIVILFIVAIIAAVIMIIWNGIRWIISGGDKGKVDEARKGVIAGLIGLVIVLAVFVLLNIVLGIFGIQGTNFGIPHF